MIKVDIGLKMKNLKDYVTVKEAAAILGVAPLTLRRWDKAGKLRAYRNPANGYRLYLRGDLRTFLKSVKRGK